MPRRVLRNLRIYLSVFIIRMLEMPPDQSQIAYLLLRAEEAIHRHADGEIHAAPAPTNLKIQEGSAAMASLISRKHAVALIKATYGIGSLSWLQRLASERRGPPTYKLNERSSLYDPDEVLAWCEANIRPAGGPSASTAPAVSVTPVQSSAEAAPPTPTIDVAAIHQGLAVAMKLA